MKDNKKFTFSRRTLSNLIVVCAGVLLYLGLSNFTAIQKSFLDVYSVISPFVIAVGIAYIVNLPARFLERTVFKNASKKHVLSVVSAYLLALLCLALLLGLVVPQVVQSVLILLRNFPMYLKNLNDLLAWLGQNFDLAPDLLDQLAVSYQDIINTVAGWFSSDLLGFTMRIGSGLIGIVTAFIASIYMLLSKEKLLRQIKRVLYAFLPQKRSDSIIRVCNLSNNVFSNFISGKVLDSAIIGGICFVFLFVMDLFFIEMPFAALISILIGVTNIIPFFGPFIGAIPSAMILLLVNPWSALWFIVFVIVLQQFDGNFLGPKILGDSTGLPALWVLISIVVGGGWFGFKGMLLGVPTAAVLYTLSSDLIARKLSKKGLAATGSPTGEEAAPAPPQKPVRRKPKGK